MTRAGGLSLIQACEEEQKKFRIICQNFKKCDKDFEGEKFDQEKETHEEIIWDVKIKWERYAYDLISSKYADNLVHELKFSIN